MKKKIATQNLHLAPGSHAPSAPPPFSFDPAINALRYSGIYDAKLLHHQKLAYRNHHLSSTTANLSEIPEFHFDFNQLNKASQRVPMFYGDCR